MERIRADRRDAAAATLAEAFWDDPLLQIAAPDEARRTRIATWFMGLPLDLGLRWGEVWGSDDASAVAVWLPPGSEVTMSRMLRIGLAAMPFRLGFGSFGRIMSTLSATESFHKQVGGPHWYLATVGTRRSRQGQGLGSALVELGTTKADEAHLPCYLETATDENIAFYGKRGFEVVGQAKVQGHTLTGMIRPAR